MDPKELLTKKNLILGAGAAAIIALVFVGIRILSSDPTSSSREAYRRSAAASSASNESNSLEKIMTGESSTNKPSPIPTPVANEDSMLPGGATVSPTPTPERPGVIQDTVEVELQPAQPKKNIFTTFPDVVIPNTITDGSLPSRQSTNNSSNVQTVFRIAPGRYLFNNLSPDVLGANALVMTRSDKDVQFSPSTFSPMGETIQLAMMDNATTQNTEINVTAAVWEPFYFQGNKLLSVGDKLLGTAAPGKQRDRMVVKFNKIIFKDGKSMPISAVAQDIDGTYGIKGIKIGDVMLNSIAPLLMDTAASFAGVLQELAYANVTAMTAGQISTQNPMYISSTPGGAQNGANQQFAQNAAQTGGEGTMTVYQKISDMLAQDIEENKPYLLVPAGTRLQAYLQAPMDITVADYGK